MSLHSLAATVISTAVLSAGATTVVNRMVGNRRGRMRGHPGAPTSPTPGTERPERTVMATGPSWSEGDLDGLTEPELERLGGKAWREGDYALAEREYQLAVVRAATPAAKARALNNLGTTYDRMGHSDKALASFTRAVDVYRAIGERHGEAEALTNLGLALGKQGQRDQATTHLSDALRLHLDNGDRFGQATVLSIMAELDRANGDLDAALATHRQALEIYCELSRADAESTCLNDCATTLLAMNQVQAALTAFANALALAQLVGADGERARAHDGIARILFSQGDRTGARTHWSSAWRLFQDSDKDSAEAVAVRLRQLN